MVRIAAVPQIDTSFLNSMIHYVIIMYGEVNPMIGILICTILGTALLLLNAFVLSSLPLEILTNLVAEDLTTILFPYNYL